MRKLTRRQVKSDGIRSRQAFRKQSAATIKTRPGARPRALADIAVKGVLLPLRKGDRSERFRIWVSAMSQNWDRVLVSRSCRYKVPLLDSGRSFSLDKIHLKLAMNVLHSGDLPNVVRIALVDDDLSMRKAISRLLSTHGYACKTYESGEEALADPALLRVDCLVVDIQLGGMNGIELCERVHALGSSVPHVFITASTDRNLPESPSHIRDSILLFKPIEEDDLIDSIERSIADRL